MIINYYSNEDKLAAELIRKQIGGSITRAIIDPRISSPTDNILIVGGQYSTPTYNNFMEAGILPEIMPGTPGTVFVTSYLGYKIYACVGDLKAGTIAAAEYVFLNGLPYSTIVVGDVGDLYLISIPINPNSTVLGAVNSALNSIRNGITNALVSFSKVDYLDLNGTNLEILLRSDSLGLGWNWPVILGIIGGAILIAVGWWIEMAFLIAVGGLTVGSALISNIWTGLRSKAKEDQLEIIDFKLSKGYSLEDAKEEAEAYRPVSITDILKYAVIIGAIGVGTYFIAKGLQKRGD